jgi:hypothetical protein
MSQQLRVYSGASAADVDTIKKWGLSKLGRRVSIEVASMATGAWTTVEGTLVEDEGLLYIMRLGTGEHLVFPESSSIYRSIVTVGTTVSHPPSRTSSPVPAAARAGTTDTTEAETASVALAESAAATELAQAASRQVQDLRADLQHVQEEIVRAAQANRAQMDVFVHGLEEQQKHAARRNAEQLDALRSEMRALSTTLAASMPPARSASPVPAPPLVLGATARVLPPVAPVSGVGGPLSPASRLRASLPPTSAPRATSNDIRVAELERSHPFWRSDRLPQNDDVFTAAEEQVLLGMPKLVLVKTEAHFSATLLAIKELAGFVVRHLDMPAADIRKRFDDDLRRRKEFLSFATADQLATTLVMLEEATTTRAHSRALWSLGLLWLRCHEDHYGAVARICCASIAAQPVGADEVRGWMASKEKVRTTPDTLVPVRSSGF